MIEADRCDDRSHWIENIGAIEFSAKAGLNNSNVDFWLFEVLKCQNSPNLKNNVEKRKWKWYFEIGEGNFRFIAKMENILEIVSGFGYRNRNIVNLNSFSSAE